MAQCLFHHGLRDMFRGIDRIHLLFQIERGSGLTQLQGGYVFFRLVLKLINTLGSLSGADNHHASGQGIQGACMAYLDLLDM